MSSKQFFYAVKSGRIPGIYTNWNDCKNQIDKFSGAIYKKFKTESEAETFLNNSDSILNDSVIVKRKKKIIYSEDSSSSDSDSESSESEPEIPQNVIYVDGGCNSTTLPYAYGSVVDCNGNDIIETYRFLLEDMKLKRVSLPVGNRTIIKVKFNDVKSQQNNGAELLATIAGMRIVLHLRNKIKHIYCDSKLIVDFWSNRLKEESASKMDPLKVEYINELISLKRRINRIDCELTKISGDDNPADLGFHKKK